MLYKIIPMRSCHSWLATLCLGLPALLSPLAWAEVFVCTGRINQQQISPPQSGFATKNFLYEEDLKVSFDEKSVVISDQSNLRSNKYLNEKGELSEGFKYKICSKSSREITFNNYYCNPSLAAKLNRFEYADFTLNLLNKKLHLNSDVRYPLDGVNFVQQGDFKCREHRSLF